MKSFVKKALTLLVCLNFFMLASCDNDSHVSATMNVWTASGSEKILRDTDYSVRYGNTTLEIAVFRNECESGQIIISPEANVNEYTLQLSDLTLTTDSSVKLSKDSFEVFNQKYVNVKQVIELVSTGGGYYPDALLPYEKAVEYSENRVEAGKNQGIWITVQPTVEQEAGVYAGNFKLTIDGKETLLPVKVTVFGHVLSEETHVKSIYGTNWNWVSRAELDVTVDMQRAYFEFLLEHRVNTGQLPGTFYNIVTKPYKSLPARFLEEAHKAAEDPRCSYYSLPTDSTTAADSDGVQRLTFDFAYFKKVLTAMAEYSVEHKVNLFKKAGFSIGFLDEYSAWGKTELAAYNLDAVWGFTAEVAEEFEQSLACDDAAFKEELLLSLADINCYLCGDPLVLEAWMDKYPNAHVLPCPLINQYNSEGYRKEINEYIANGYNEKWVYTACNLYPSTSYFIESPAMSPRLNGWMMYDYDITGDIYWETAFYHEWNSSQSTLQIQNQYDMAMRQANSNGEGQLLYPGREYGIFGPVGSIRLQAVRDSHEDYDLFYELEQLYKTRGVTADEFDSIYHFLTKGLYSGTRYLEAANAIELLNNSRYKLAQLFDLYSENGLAIHGYNISAGKCTVKLSALEGTTVKVNDTVLQGTANGAWRTYTHTFVLDQEENVLKVQAEKDGKSNAVEFSLGGKVETVSVLDVQEKCSIVNGASSAVDQALNCLIIEPNGEDGLLSVKLDVSAWKVDETKEGISLCIYVYGEEALDVDIVAKMKNSRAAKDIVTATLQPGWNEIQIDVATQLKCATNGALEYFLVELRGEDKSKFGLGEIIFVG